MATELRPEWRVTLAQHPLPLVQPWSNRRGVGHGGDGIRICQPVNGLASSKNIGGCDAWRTATSERGASSPAAGEHSRPSYAGAAWRALSWGGLRRPPYHDA
jgi:hypothetical protein